MAGKRHSHDEIERLLRQAQAAIDGGASVLDVCRQISISEATYHRWRKKYAAQRKNGRRTSPLRDELPRRLKELEKENKRLKQLVGQLMLDNALLKDALEVKHTRSGL